MNSNKAKVITLTLMLFITTWVSAPVLATNTGLQTLGNTSSNIDVFTFSCSAGTGPRARVNDSVTPNPAGVNMQVVLGQSSVPSLQITDTTDDGLASAWSAIIRVSGSHVVAFKKTGAASESYTGDVECCTTSSVCSGTVGGALVRQINQ